MTNRASQFLDVGFKPPKTIINFHTSNSIPTPSIGSSPSRDLGKQSQSTVADTFIDVINHSGRGVLTLAAFNVNVGAPGGYTPYTYPHPRDQIEYHPNLTLGQS